MRYAFGLLGSLCCAPYCFHHFILKTEVQGKTVTGKQRVRKSTEEWREGVDELFL
jgi:hypothetical protein